MHTHMHTHVCACALARALHPPSPLLSLVHAPPPLFIHIGHARARVHAGVTWAAHVGCLMCYALLLMPGFVRVGVFASGWVCLGRWLGGWVGLFASGWVRWGRCGWVGGWVGGWVCLPQYGCVWVGAGRSVAGWVGGWVCCPHVSMHCICAAGGGDSSRQSGCQSVPRPLPPPPPWYGCLAAPWRCLSVPRPFPPPTQPNPTQPISLHHPHQRRPGVTHSSSCV